MNIQYKECNWQDLGMVQAWLDSLSSKFDSFTEDHIVRASFHRISVDDREWGTSRCTLGAC
ncbi:MAG: hypothetical protein QF735_13235 [Phycisphaeraceae bacterium]|nr:hypothetical protein [Phycisphaeraceae bacterium]